MNPETTKQENNKPFFLVLIFLCVAIIILGAINVVLAVSGNGKNNDDGNANTSSNVKVPFDQLTKEQALQFYVDVLGRYYIPDGLISDDVSPTEDEAGIYLLSSYEDGQNIADLNDFKSGTIIDYEMVSENGNYYKVFTVKDAEMQNLWRGISFNKDYLDYDSTTSEVVFNDKTMEFAKIALPILLITEGNSRAPDGIYDYAFNENDNSISLTAYNIKIGADASALKEGNVPFTELPRAINLCAIRCTIDKNTGEISWSESEGLFGKQRFVIVNSFPLTEDDQMFIDAEAYKKAYEQMEKEEE